MKFPHLYFFLPLTLLLSCSVPVLTRAVENEALTGAAAMGDWTTDSPGVRRRITVADLPPPNQKESANNRPKEVKRPADAWPKVPEGFKVELFATDFTNPRVVATAPNGDIFVAESEANRISILRDADGDGKPEVREIFAEGLKQPFGIAFYPPGPEPQYIYIGNTDAVVRLPYRNGQTKAEGTPQRLVELSGGGQLTGGGHWTRDIVFFSGWPKALHLDRLEIQRRLDKGGGGTLPHLRDGSRGPE